MTAPSHRSAAEDGLLTDAELAELERAIDHAADQIGRSRSEALAGAVALGAGAFLLGILLPWTDPNAARPDLATMTSARAWALAAGALVVAAVPAGIAVRRLRPLAGVMVVLASAGGAAAGYTAVADAGLASPGPLLTVVASLWLGVIAVAWTATGYRYGDPREGPPI
jgi:peptidoglycan/LPS O-acetylase OafA/YrhL